MEKKKDESIGALWISDNPKIAFSGTLNMESGKTKIIVFKNSFKKEGETSPDYKIYISKPMGSKATPISETAQDFNNSQGADDMPF